MDVEYKFKVRRRYSDDEEALIERIFKSLGEKQRIPSYRLESGSKVYKANTYDGVENKPYRPDPDYSKEQNHFLKCLPDLIRILRGSETLFRVSIDETKEMECAKEICALAATALESERVEALYKVLIKMGQHHYACELIRARCGVLCGDFEMDKPVLEKMAGLRELIKLRPRRSRSGTKQKTYLIPFAASIMQTLERDNFKCGSTRCGLWSIVVSELELFLCRKLLTKSISQADDGTFKNLEPLYKKVRMFITRRQKLSSKR